MDLKVTPHDGYVLAQISGPLDESAREQFREKLHPLFANRGTRLIIDLADSLRINSPGIGNLVALVADANTNDSRVILCNLQPFVSSVMGVTKLNTYFEIAADTEAAIARAGQPRPATNL